MPKFEDFIEHFHYDPETFKPDEFREAAKAAHTEDITLANQAATAKDEQIAALTTEKKDLGLALWEAQMKQGVPIPPNSQPGGGQEEHKPKPISEMFKKVNRR